MFVLIGAAYDGGGHHPYAFWLHVVGGLSVGGGILWFWHEHTWEWLLVLIVSLIYIAVARSLGRSSYAVLGALGLAGTATYFIEKWFSFGDARAVLPVRARTTRTSGADRSSTWRSAPSSSSSGSSSSAAALPPQAEPAPTIH